ncbi:hypothetical protein AD939_03975, partial [Gluconobacter oxydans]
EGILTDQVIESLWAVFAGQNAIGRGLGSRKRRHFRLWRVSKEAAAIFGRQGEIVVFISHEIV